MGARVFAAMATLAALALAGCGGGGPAERSDVQLGNDEQLYAAGLRSEVSYLADSYRQEGLGGLKGALEASMENLEAMEANVEVAGQYRETCEKIIEGIRSLNVTAQSSPGQVQAKLDELQQLAEKLPKSGVEGAGTGAAQT